MDYNERSARIIRIIQEDVIIELQTKIIQSNVHRDLDSMLWTFGLERLPVVQ